MLDEWRVGICYSSGKKQTVPMERLEKELQEGVQQPSSSGITPSHLPWRQGIKDRNIIRDRKILIYGMLQAELDGKNLQQFMDEQMAQVEKAIKESRSRGQTTSPLAEIKRRFEKAATFRSPVEFEEHVLGWKLTTKVKNQAASKKAGRAYPPDGVGSSALS